MPKRRLKNQHNIFVKTQNAPTTKKNKTNTSQNKANTPQPATNATNAYTTKHSIKHYNLPYIRTLPIF
jgi:hypothetical protein